MGASARFHIFMRFVIGLFSTRINQRSAMKKSRYYCASDAIVEGKSLCWIWKTTRRMEEEDDNNDIKTQEIGIL